MYSQRDIFDDKAYNYWLNHYYHGNDEITEVFFRECADDLYGPDIPDEIKPIIDVIKKMVDPDINKRPTLDEAIRVITEQKYKLEYNIFKENLTNLNKDGKYVVTPKDVENPYIKDEIFNRINENDSKFINKIDKSSLFILLKQAVIDNNITIFNNLVTPYGLKDQKNHGYAQVILQKIIENAAKTGKYEMLEAYIRSSDPLVMKTDIKNALIKYKGTDVSRNINKIIDQYPDLNKNSIEKIDQLWSAHSNISEQYHKADAKKKFRTLSQYSVFQHPQRETHINQLQKAINEARDNVIKDPSSAIKKLEDEISKLSDTMKQEQVQGHRKLGESRFEKVLSDLNKDLQELKKTLNADVNANLNIEIRKTELPHKITPKRGNKH